MHVYICPRPSMSRVLINCVGEVKIELPCIIKMCNREGLGTEVMYIHMYCTR